ncbi:PEF1-like protein [Lachancea thermotolerans]
MCARRLNYAGGDNLPLYATPEEAMRAGQQREQREQREQEERRRRQKRQEQRLPPPRNGRVGSAPPAVPQHYMGPAPGAVPVSRYAPIPAAPVVRVPRSRPAPAPAAASMPAAMPVAAAAPLAYSPSPPQPAPAPVPMSAPTTARNSLESDTQQSFKDTQIATQLFQNHDVKQRGRLTAAELQNLLQNDDNSHFCISSVDALINLFGASRFGTVSLTEFISLYRRVKKWRKVYVDNDINGSFTISASEFHNSLQELGYLVPFDVSENLFDQYAEFIDPGKNGKELKFDRFVETLVWLMRLTKVFRKFDTNQEGVATVQYKDFIDATLYLGRFLPH